MPDEPEDLETLLSRLTFEHEMAKRAEIEEELRRRGWRPPQNDLFTIRGVRSESDQAVGSAAPAIPPVRRVATERTKPKRKRRKPSKADAHQRHELGLFLAIVAVLAVPFIFALQANGVEIGWRLSAVIYLVCVGTFIWAYTKWDTPHKWKPLIRFGILGLILLALGSISTVGVTNQYTKEHPAKTESAGAPIFVALKDPQEWFDPSGKRYPQSEYPLSLDAPRVVRVGEWHSLNPCVGSKVTTLVNSTIYVKFDRGVDVKPDGWWTLNTGTASGGLQFVGHFTPINQGECGGGQAVLRFKPSAPGPVTVGYAVTAFGVNAVEVFDRFEAK